MRNDIHSEPVVSADADIVDLMFAVNGIACAMELMLERPDTELMLNDPDAYLRRVALRDLVTIVRLLLEELCDRVASQDKLAAD